MSRIDDMIAHLCPNGVEYFNLEELAEIGTGSSDRKDASDVGAYPFYVRSKEILFKDDYEYDEEAVIIPGEGGIGEIFHYVNGPYALHQRVYRIHLVKECLNTKFLIHYMQSVFKEFILKKAVSATVTSIRKPMIQKFPVPIPPLEVQEEIVRVLDSFTELEAELEAELEVRKRQYSHYRDELLAFSDDENVQWLKLGKVASLVRGVRVIKKNLREGGGWPVYQNSLTPLGFHTKWNSTGGTTFVICAGAAGEVGYSAEKFWAADDCFCLNCSEKLLDRFVYHVLISQQKILLSQVRRASVPRLSRSAIERLLIPVPPLEEQERIVATLDKFDALVNDISQGIPAEIEARRKQYAYYRDMLLSFEEKNG